MIRVDARLGAVAAAVTLAATGCVTEGDWTTVAPTRTTFVATTGTRPLDYGAGILPLGSVPYDNRSLPLVSPDGRLVATQAGEPPDWDTVIAAGTSSVPLTHVEIHSLDRTLGRTRWQWATETALLLGRAGDEKRFLVESVRGDGARWIGAVSWFGGAIDWLVADEHVNAFACMDPDGRLAWSRRAPDAQHFDLVIRDGDTEWTVGAQGGDWLVPTWSGRRGGLFAIRLIDGTLQATYMNASTPGTTRATLQRMTIATEMSRYDAYQTMASQALITGVAADDPVSLIFWHPTAGRIALWRPLLSPAAPLLLEEHSIAAVADPTGHVLVATDAVLSLQSLDDLSERRPLVPGTYVPRPVNVPGWPYVLLSPGTDRIGLVALRLLPLE